MYNNVYRVHILHVLLYIGTRMVRKDFVKYHKHTIEEQW